MELKPCPWCRCEMRIQSNSDWHKPIGSHSPLCPIEGWAPMYPATDSGLSELAESWNTRAADAEVERLATIATKWTPADHHDWHEVQRLISAIDAAKGE